MHANCNYMFLKINLRILQYLNLWVGITQSQSHSESGSLRVRVTQSQGHWESRSLRVRVTLSESQSEWRRARVTPQLTAQLVRTLRQPNTRKIQVSEGRFCVLSQIGSAVASVILLLLLLLNVIIIVIFIVMIIFNHFLNFP